MFYQTNIKMNIEKAYNVWAAQYDTNLNATRDLDKVSTIQTLDKIQFSTVIELACGTGKNTQYLLTKADKVIGLDFSEEMLKKAKEKITSKRVEFRRVDISSDWNIENNFADLITCNLVLEHIENLDKIFKQAKDKLKDGGVFFISELHPFKQYLGSKARFEIQNKTVELKTYTHHISEYLETARANGFKLMELNEWFDNDAEKTTPRLIGLSFCKNCVNL